MENQVFKCKNFNIIQQKEVFKVGTDAFLLGSLFSMQTAPLIIVACYGVFTLFAFITLPVEFDASSRALAWIQRTGITDYYSRSKAEKALRLAASTYVIAAVYSLATLLYYLFALLGHSDE